MTKEFDSNSAASTAPKLTSDNYQFDVVLLNMGGLNVILRKVDTAQEKVFFLATRNVAGVTSHMCSLTDDLCSQWFNARRQEGKKKSKAQ